MEYRSPTQKAMDAVNALRTRPGAQYQGKTGPSQMGNLGRQFGEGLTLGWYGEITAGIDAMMQGEAPFVSDAYRQALAQIDGDMARFQQEYPGLAVIAEIAGSLALPVGGSYGAMKGATSLVGKGLRGAAVGGTTTGVYAAGKAQGTPGQVTGQALSEIPEGAAVGAAFPVVGHALEKFMRWAGGTARQGREILADYVKQDIQSGAGPTRDLSAAIDRAAERIDRNPELTVMDALAGGGKMPNVEALADFAAVTPGGGMTLIRQTLAKRRWRQGNRVRAVAQGIDKRNYFDEVDRLLALREGESFAAYNKAYSAMPEVTDKEILVMMAKPESKKAFDKQMKRLQRFGEDEVEGLSPLWSADGSIARAITTKDVDLVARWMLNQGRKAKLKKGDADLSRLYFKNGGALRERMREVNPEYGVALDAFSNPTALMEAMDAGRAYLKSPSAENLAEFKKLKGSEKDAFRVGFFTDLIEKIDGTADRRDILNALFGSKDRRKKFLQIMPEGIEERAKVMSALADEFRMAHVERALNLNSKTGQRSQVASDVGMPEGGQGRSFEEILLRMFSGAYAQAQDNAARARLGAIADDLFSKDRAKQGAALIALRDNMLAAAVTKINNNPVVKGVQRLGPGAAPVLTLDTQEPSQPPLR